SSSPRYTAICWAKFFFGVTIQACGRADSLSAVLISEMTILPPTQQQEKLCATPCCSVRLHTHTSISSTEITTALMFPVCRMESLEEFCFALWNRCSGLKLWHKLAESLSMR